MMIEVVVMPDDAEAARWAGSINDADRGALVVYFPPSAQSITAFCREVLAAIGMSVGDAPDGLSAEEASALCVAWLAGHEIREMIILHAEWIRRDLIEPICALATLAGVNLTLLTSGTAERFAGWAYERRGWTDFVAAAARHADAPPTKNANAASMAIAGFSMFCDRHPLEDDRVEGSEATAAFLDMTACIQRGGRTRLALARSLVQVLKRFELSPSARMGAASALRRAGWDLWAAGPAYAYSSSPQWRDLRTAVFPHQPAAVAVLCAGAWPDEAARLSIADVAADGSAVRIADAWRDVPGGGVPYVRAQLRLRQIAGAAPRDAFFVHRGRNLARHAVALAAQVQLESVGLKFSLTAIEGRMSPSERWLARMGLGLVERPTPVISVNKARVCVHGVPESITVDGVGLSHSQRLCRGDGPAETRHIQVRPRDAGYELELVTKSTLGCVYAVTRNGEPRGQLVSVHADDSQIWLQVGTASAPPLDRLHDAIAMARQSPF